MRPAKRSIGRVVMVLAVASALAVALGAVPALAAAPAGPSSIMTEGFEGPGASYTISQYYAPPNYLGYGHWGRVVQRKRTGTYGLWCAGSRLTTTSALSTYWQFSGGTTTFNLPQLSEYYSANLDFYYSQPSLGVQDDTSFNVYWNSVTDTRTTDPHYWYPLTAKYAWSKQTHDLSSANGAAPLSRVGGQLSFQWIDHYDPFGVALGEGPTVDDIAVTGWKFGPVRDLSATLDAGTVTLEWLRPYRSTISTAPEERALAYRVFSAPGGTANWTEIAVPAVGNTATSFEAAAGSEGSQTRYAVQPSEPGGGAGAGAASEITLTVPAHSPELAVASPVAGFSLSGGPVTIAGTAADDGSGVSAVDVRLRRSDGQYWNGSAWQAAEAWIPAGSTNGFATWSLTWDPDAATIAGGQTVTVVARARDRAGLTIASPPVVSSGTPVVDSTAPTLALTGPAAGFSLTSGPVRVFGTAGDQGSGLDSVGIVVSRAGVYWNGIGWQSTPATLAVSGTTSWSATWTPDVVSSLGFEPVTITVTAEDFAGNRSSASRVSVDPTEPTALPARVSASIVSYKGSASLSGTLTANVSGARASTPVYAQKYYSTGWKTISSARYTNAQGAVVHTLSGLTSTGKYRLAFLGDSQYQAAYSSAVTIAPRVSLGAPYAPSSAQRYRAFTSYGSLNPRHAYRSYPVRIYRERYLGGGKWKSYGYVKAMAYNYSSYSRYKASISLSAGTWRLRAYAPADSAHAATYSGYSRTFTVR